MFLDETKTMGLFYACMCNCVAPEYVFRHNFLLNQTKLELANRYRLVLSEISSFYSDANDQVNFERRPHDNHLTLWEIFLGKNSIGKSALDWLTESSENLLERRCEMDGTLAATKIIIASHLFERTTGRRPQTLDELVPDFLASVLLDPFDGNPFRYNPDKGVIYSVGTSLKDLGGLVFAPDSEPSESMLELVKDNPWKGDNAVFHIWDF